MMNPLIRCLCLVFLLSTELCLAEPISLSGEVEAGSEDNRLSIRIKNKTDMPVEGVNLSVGEKPSFIKDVVITPSTIEEIAPKQTEAFEVSFNVDPELKEDQNAAVTFMLSTVKGKLETNTATLDLSVKALEAPSTSLCWSRVEGGTLVLHDPPLDDCEFNGPCEAAAAFARQNNYGFDGAGRCEAAPETGEGPRELQLTRIYGSESFAIKNTSLYDELVFNHEKDATGVDRHYSRTKKVDGSVTRDGKGFIQTMSSQESTGFTEFPETITLGKPFTFKSSLRAQMTKTNEFCAGKEKLESGARIGFGRKQMSYRMAYKVIDSIKMDCEGTANINLGEESGVSINCLPLDEGIKDESSGAYVRYHYSCQSVGENITRYTGSKISLLWPLVPVDNNGQFPGYNNSIEQSWFKARTGFSLTHGPDNLQMTFLEYRPFLKEQNPKETTASPYEHPFELKPDSKEPGDGESEKPGNEKTEDLAGKGDGRTGQDNNDREGNGNQAVSSSQEGESTASSGETEAQQAVREKEQRRPHIEYWLGNAQPVENAQPGYNLAFDKWGRVQGKTANGTITLNSKPEGAGTDSMDYVWTHEREKDSLNLCTLGEYVERQLAGKETASCQKSVPKPPVDHNSVPNLVGTSAKQAKTQLAELGVPIHWKAGSLSQNASQTGKVEKQNPPPGTDLKTVTRVELWVYRPVANTATVPNVVGMYFKKAAEKLKQAGLVPGLGKTHLPRSRENAGKVVSQETPPGKNIVKGATVVLNINRGGIYKAIMPDIAGMKYDEAAAKLKEVGLKPLKKLGPRAPSQALVNTVAETGLPKANQRIALGTLISLTVYNSVGNNVKPPRKIVKRDPASAFGKETSSEKPEGIAANWAGTWNVDDKYNMELHVSGNKVTGKYGNKMEQSIEGTVSGGTLTGLWMKGKSRGRFENKISADGNSWKGVWSSNEKSKGWNGGWKGKRIGKKKPPENLSKRDPASAFGDSDGGNTSSSGAFNCQTGIPGLVLESSGRKYPDRKNGVLKTDVNGEKNYICRYKIKGRQRIALISYFDKEPITQKGKRLRDHMCSVFGRMKWGKALFVNLEGPSLNKGVGKENAKRFFPFHINQIAPHAISCSGGSRSNNSGSTGNTGITTNRSRQKMQGGNFGGVSSCRWDGGHDLLGIPGVEVRVYCKCNGKIANDSRCSGQKPKGNHYYGK